MQVQGLRGDTEGLEHRTAESGCAAQLALKVILLSQLPKVNPESTGAPLCSAFLFLIDLTLLHFLFAHGVTGLFYLHCVYFKCEGCFFVVVVAVFALLLHFWGHRVSWTFS